MKRLTPEEIANFPHKNVIVRALGMKDTVKVDTRFEVPQLERRLPALLRRPLAARSKDEQMLDILAEHAQRPQDRARRKLIEPANENGGPDNITAVLVRWTQ